MSGSELIVFRCPPALLAAIKEREGDGESPSLVARWMVEQYLGIVELITLGEKDPTGVVTMILADDQMRRHKVLT